MYFLPILEETGLTGDAEEGSGGGGGDRGCVKAAAGFALVWGVPAIFFFSWLEEQEMWREKKQERRWS